MSPESKQRIQGWTWKRKEKICLGRGVIKTKLCALPKCKFRIIFPSDNSLYFSLIFFLLVGLRQSAPAQAILLLGWLLLASVAWSNADQRQHNAPCGLERVWEQKAQVLQQCLYSASLFRGEMLKATFHPKSLKVFRLSCAQTGEVFFHFLLRACAPCSWADNLPGAWCVRAEHLSVGLVWSPAELLPAEFPECCLAFSSQGCLLSCGALPLHKQCYIIWDTAYECH